VKDTKLIDFWTGIGVIALGIVTIVLTEGMQKVSQGIGPGDYPRVIAIGLCALGAILAAQSALKGFPRPQGGILWNQIGRVLVMVLATFAYLQLMRYLGFLLITPFFLAATIYLYGYRKRKILIAVSIGVSAAVYFIFYSVFLVLLPRFSLF